MNFRRRVGLPVQKNFAQSSKSHLRILSLHSMNSSCLCFSFHSARSSLKLSCNRSSLLFSSLRPLPEFGSSTRRTVDKILYHFRFDEWQTLCVSRPSLLRLNSSTLTEGDFLATIIGQTWGRVSMYAEPIMEEAIAFGHFTPEQWMQIHKECKR